MKTRFCCFALSFITFVSVLFGQARPDSSQLTAQQELYNRFDSSLAVVWNEQKGTADIITLGKPRSFAQDPAASAAAFLQELRALLKKRDTDDEFRVERSLEKKGVHHVRFKQYYKNVPVSGGEYVVTVLSGGNVQTALGEFYPDIQLDVSPLLNVQQGLSIARQNEPPNVELKDSLHGSRLVVYPKDGTYRLAWEIYTLTERGVGEWVYIIDASDGTILDRYNGAPSEIIAQPIMAKPLAKTSADEVVGKNSSATLVPEPQTNAYPRHPGLDASYSLIQPINVDQSGYLKGTYADVLNDEAARASDPVNFDFRYETSSTHFDEGNLFYHIDRFRRSYWNILDDVFNPFTQIVAHAHWSNETNAQYSMFTDKHIRFGDGGGVSGFNSFAREDKVIQHEYTHAVTDYIAGISYTGSGETSSIHEGNSDYFPGAFTSRTVIGEYAAPAYQRDMLNPVITNYAGQDWPNVEAHEGGEFWSASLWDLRSHASIGANVADWLIYLGLYGLPTSSSFVQYRQAIIDKDKNQYSGVHVNNIAHVFYLRGIGTDSVGVFISGPTELQWKDFGTWTANPSGGAGSYTYEWRFREYPSGTWSGVVSTSSQYTRQMLITDMELQVKVTSAGEFSYDTHIVLEGSTFAGKLAQSDNQVDALPTEFSLSQNYPNPFNPETEIGFALPEPAAVRISVVDLLGREVAILEDRKLSAGYKSVTWNGSSANGEPAGSGLYFLRMTAIGESGNSFTRTMKMLMTK